MLTHFVQINNLDAMHSSRTNLKLTNTLKFANFSLNNTSQLTGSTKTIMLEVLLNHVSHYCLSYLLYIMTFFIKFFQCKI